MEALKPAAPLSSASGPNPGARPGKSRRILKYLGYGALALAVILLIAHLVWNGAGSNQWELAMDKNGVKVWTLKTPGSNLVRVKAATRITSSLGGMVKLLEDLGSCVDAKCYDAKVLQAIDTVPGRYAAYVRFKFDLPGMATRDYVLLQEHVQDPVSKRLEINVIAAPNRVARDPCCIRITHLHNHWTLTPLANRQLDIEFTQDTDIGGMPYVMANLALKLGTYEIIHGMQDLMNMGKYRDAQVGYIQELAAN